MQTSDSTGEVAAAAQTTTVSAMLAIVYQAAIQINDGDHCDVEMDDQTDQKNSEPHAQSVEDELCAICYTSELSSEEHVELGCGHRYHAACVRALLTHKWSTLRINFGFMQCPQCKAEISGEGLEAEMAPLFKLKKRVEQMALKVARAQALDKDERLNGRTDEASILAFAMEQCTFYECAGCQKPFFGGLRDCQADLAMSETASKEDLLCKGCQVKAYGAGQAVCQEHGTKHIDWKCLFCCSLAVYFCYGTHYMCARCHDEYTTPPMDQVTLRDCQGSAADCPLGVPHPTANPDYKKSTFPLGCNLCRTGENGNKMAGKKIAAVEIGIEFGAQEEEEVKAVLPQTGGMRTTEEQRQLLQRERQERVESQREAQLRLRLQKTALLKQKSLEENRQREMKLQARMKRENESAAAASSSSSSSPKGEGPAEVQQKPQKPLTAAEIRKQKLIARKEEMVERKRLQLIKLEEERLAKIEALNAKLAQGLDSSANTQKAKEFAKRMTANVVKKRPQTAVPAKKALN